MKYLQYTCVLSATHHERLAVRFSTCIIVEKVRFWNILNLELLDQGCSTCISLSVVHPKMDKSLASEHLVGNLLTSAVPIFLGS
jgi:hypothetical protein